MLHAQPNQEHLSPFRFPISVHHALRQQERSTDEGPVFSSDLWAAGGNR